MSNSNDKPGHDPLNGADVTRDIQRGQVGTRIRMGVRDGHIVLMFEGSISWFALTGDQAVNLANLLFDHARMVGTTKPVIYRG